MLSYTLGLSSIAEAGQNRGVAKDMWGLMWVGRSWKIFFRHLSVLSILRQLLQPIHHPHRHLPLLRLDLHPKLIPQRLLERQR